jgi:hypothetical protein
MRVRKTRLVCIQGLNFAAQVSVEVSSACAGSVRAFCAIVRHEQVFTAGTFQVFLESLQRQTASSADLTGLQTEA